MSLGDETTRPRGLYRPVKLHELIDVLKEHNGLEDVPVNTISKIGDTVGFSMTVLDYAERILKGDKVYQYIVEWTPDWIAARRNNSISKPVPEGMISADKAAEIKNVSPKTVADRIASKELNGGQYSGEWYLVPDILFQTWVTSMEDPTSLHRRLLFLQDAVDMYTGSDIKEVYQIATEMESKFGPPLRGRYAKRSIAEHFKAYFKNIVPKNVDTLRKYIQEYIETLDKNQEELYNS